MCIIVHVRAYVCVYAVCEKDKGEMCPNSQKEITGKMVHRVSGMSMR